MRYEVEGVRDRYGHGACPIDVSGDSLSPVCSGAGPRDGNASTQLLE